MFTSNRKIILQYRGGLWTILDLPLKEHYLKKATKAKSEDLVEVSYLSVVPSKKL